MFSSLPRSIYKHFDGGKVKIGVFQTHGSLQILIVRKVGGIL